MWRKSGFVLIVIIMMLACSEDEQPTDSRATVSFVQDSLLSPGGVYVTLDDGSTAWAFEPENFKQSPKDTNLFLGPEVQTRAAGTLMMTFRIMDDDENSLSEGSIAAPLSPNWRWSFKLIHAASNLAFDCDGCIRSDDFEILDQDHTDESIYVIWSGRGP